MRRWGFVVAMLLGGIGGGVGAGACTDGATIAEACEVICGCREILPSQRAQCEAQCAAPGDAPPPQECLECIVANEDCGRLESACKDECQVMNGGNP